MGLMIYLCMCVRMYISWLLMHCSLASLYLEVLGCSWVGAGVGGSMGRVALLIRLVVCAWLGGGNKYILVFLA